VNRCASTMAPAKVNLVLRVLGPRGDGYHDIETLFQAIDLGDEVGVELLGSRVELDVRGADLGPLEDNLAYRAATALRDRLGLQDGVRISLTKRIPAGAGLGGGSSDAAAVLRCMAALLDVGEGGVVREIGVGLGSDVPFFLGASPLAWGRGRGEALEPLEPLPQADLVLVSPPVHVSTAAAYRALDEDRQAARASGASPNPLFTPESWSDLEARLSNDFQKIVADAHPDVARSLDALTRAGAEAALLSGSGSSCFGLFSGRAAARGAAERMRRELGWPCRPVRTLTELPRLRNA
jgi:4-diphosphocytidyl-2-C-methyl-D-erythritol kinase